MCLESNNLQHYEGLKGTISIRKILESDEWTFSMFLNGGLEKEKLIKPIATIASNWLSVNGMENPLAAAAFASQIVSVEPTWTLPDIVCFFDFIISNQHDDRLKFYGTVVTPIMLMKMVSVYNEKVADEREQYWAEQKGEHTTPSPRMNSDQSVKATMGKILESVQIRDQDKRPYDGIPPDENYFKKLIPTEQS